jgi:hypothetical protein
MSKFFQLLEHFERNYARIFWLYTSLLGFFLFHEPVQISSHSQVVIEQLRGETQDSENFFDYLIDKPKFVLYGVIL